MTTTSIILLFLGIAFLIVSFFLVDHSNNQTMNSQAQQSPVFFSELQQKEIKEKINAMVEEICSEKIVDMDDQLSSLSNEKIIAVNDYSEQLMEKLEENHKQAVFLYDMLRQKDEEIKTLFQKMDTIRRENKEFLEKLTSLMESRTKKKDVKPTQNGTVMKETKDTQHQAIKLETAMAESPEIEDLTSEESKQNKVNEILDLHHKNKSVLDISKQLGIGQGEVKLIIDLYAGK